MYYCGIFFTSTPLSSKASSCQKGSHQPHGTEIEQSVSADCIVMIDTIKPTSAVPCRAEPATRYEAGSEGPVELIFFQKTTPPLAAQHGTFQRRSPQSCLVARICHVVSAKSFKHIAPLHQTRPTHRITFRLDRNPFCSQNVQHMVRTRPTASIRFKMSSPLQNLSSSERNQTNAITWNRNSFTFP